MFVSDVLEERNYLKTGESWGRGGGR